MIRRSLFILAALCLLALPGISQAYTIDFEDHPIDSWKDGTRIDTGYRGFNWNVGYIRSLAGPNNDALNDAFSPAISGNQGGYSYDSMTISTVDWNETFDFNSMVISSNWFDGMDLLIAGYKGSQLISSTLTTLKMRDATRISFGNMIGLNKLVFTASGGVIDPAQSPNSARTFTFDNMVFNESSTVPTPEPATFLLLGLGLIAVLAVNRKSLSAQS